MKSKPKTKHVKVYKIFRVSEDGLLKHHKKSTYYGYENDSFDNSYETEEAAIEDIIENELLGSVILTAIEERWVWDD